MHQQAPPEAPALKPCVDGQAAKKNGGKCRVTRQPAGEVVGKILRDEGGRAERVGADDAALALDQDMAVGDPTLVILTRLPLEIPV